MRTRTHNSIRRSLENLEARDTPAGTATATLDGRLTLQEALAVGKTPGGTVSATFTAGRLTLTGDAADNTLLITMGWDDRLTISGNESGTVVRLNGGPAGDSITLPTPLTGAVTINLGDGADDLTIHTVDLPGSLTINGGNGVAGGPDGNKVTIRGGVLIGGNLSITNLAGSDTTQLQDLIRVEGGMAIRNGPGGSLVTSEPTMDLRVGGALSFAGGAGYDKVDMWHPVGVAVGSLTFNIGPDRDGSYFRVHPLGDLSVAGAVRVTNGGGEDHNNLGGQNLTIGGAVTIQNGDGGSFNTLLAWGTMSVGQVSVTSGVGYDDNTIQIYDRGVIRGNVSFANGSGDSVNYVGSGNLLSVGGNISVTNGAGHDVNAIGSGDTHVSGSITIRNGSGSSSTVVTADNLLFVSGTTKITSGIGKDLVFVGPGQVEENPTPAVDVGPVLINNGDGDSDTTILGTRLAVRGSVDVTAGNGTDRVIVGCFEDHGSVAGDVFIDIGAGNDQSVAVGASDGRVLTIGKSLGIWTEDSVAINLWTVDVRSWTEIVTGDGADQLQITDSSFGGEFDLDTGTSDDVVQLEWNGSVTYFRGPVTVYTGDGNDQMWLTGDTGGENGLTVFAGPTFWDGGAGTDVFVGRNFGALFYGPAPDIGRYEATV